MRLYEFVKEENLEELNLKGALAGAALATMGATAASGTYAYDKLLTTNEPTAIEKHTDADKAKVKATNRQKARPKKRK